jgi:hypothetical protein
LNIYFFFFYLLVIFNKIRQNQEKANLKTNVTGEWEVLDNPSESEEEFDGLVDSFWELVLFLYSFMIKIEYYIVIFYFRMKKKQMNLYFSLTSSLLQMIPSLMEIRIILGVIFYPLILFILLK